MSTSAAQRDVRRVELSRKPLHSGTGERVIRVYQDHRGAVLDIVLTDREREWGRFTFRQEHVPLLTKAIAEARTGGPVTRIVGTIVGSTISIEVAVARHSDQDLLIFKRSSDRMPRGKPVTISGLELDALETGIGMLETGVL